MPYKFKGKTIFNIKNNIYIQMGALQLDCPCCGNKLAIGMITLREQTETLFCIDCDLQIVMPLIVINQIKVTLK